MGLHGQLGLGDDISSISVPTSVSSLEDEKIVQISANGDVSAAITSKGDLYTWGKTQGGSMGQAS